jgi:SAM-dependent methyltransferase
MSEPSPGGAESESAPSCGGAGSENASSSGDALAPREAYGRWAARYETGGVFLGIDELAVARLSPPSFTRLLDAACGTGHRIPRGTRAIGVDLVFEMLAAAPRDGRRLSTGDVRALPLRSGSFDLVWCRLAAGYVEPLAVLYAELSRVAARGGSVVVTDLHPEASRRGHERGFRDEGGAFQRIAHVAHGVEAHQQAARDAGLAIEERLELTVGPGVRSLFEEAGESARYKRLIGLPVLLGFRFAKQD